jgi:hypothetical protein
MSRVSVLQNCLDYVSWEPPVFIVNFLAESFELLFSVFLQVFDHNVKIYYLNCPVEIGI